MGSRRLLFEAESGSNATAGLDLSLVEKVCGSVSVAQGSVCIVCDTGLVLAAVIAARSATVAT